MGMQINTNLAANNAYRSLSNTQNDLSKSLEKLSSGLRINRAGDDAAGLALSEGLKSQIGGLTVASRNAQDAIGMVQTAEGGLSQAQSILQRLRDLGVQAANDTNNEKSREAIATEATSLVGELGRIASSTNFNGTNLLDSAKTLNFQVGANADSSSQIAVTTTDLSEIASDLGTGKATQFTGGGTAGAATFQIVKGSATTTLTTDAISLTNADSSAKSPAQIAQALNDDAKFAAEMVAYVSDDKLQVRALSGGTVTETSTTKVLGTDAGTPSTVALDFSTASASQAAVKTLDEAITAVSTGRASLGASQNRLESAVQTINVAKENLTASNSRIRDTDMAEEMVKFTRNNILSQAGTAMLAQANQSNQGVLQLLR
ncbi:Flagellin [Arthrobacter sp. 9AX]|uniref:flagellin N-terminal helical domain-containing protein n=1 Tax=Arthrobacter sp. 9AX TaxID=2653131 RepID=UPI0012F44345|nr:flagellin [Arthrobacter sp. 9AX]VXB81285.1 Flagellin [Arthrobacter sp. 9AX]